MWTAHHIIALMKMVSEFIDGHDVVVFVHGLFGGLSNFTYCLNELSQHVECCVPELPLYDSDHKKPLLFLHTWLHDYLISRYPNAKFHLVGNSLGGQLSIMLARDYPNLVASLTLTGSAGLGEKVFQSSFPKRFCSDFIREKAADTFYELEVSDDLVLHIQSIISERNKLLRLIRLAKHSFQINLLEDLGEIDCPVHLIWGEQDQITPLSQALIFQQELNGTLDIIPKCGHAPMMEKPISFSNSLLTFLEKHLSYEFSKNYSH